MNIENKYIQNENYGLILQVYYLLNESLNSQFYLLKRLFELFIYFIWLKPATSICITTPFKA